MTHQVRLSRTWKFRSRHQDPDYSKQPSLQITFAVLVAEFLLHQAKIYVIATFQSYCQWVLEAHVRLEGQPSRSKIPEDLSGPFNVLLRTGRSHGSRRNPSIISLLFTNLARPCSFPPD